MGVSTITQDFESIFKVVIVGDAGCGKNALMTRFAQGNFPEVCYDQTTTSMQFARKKFTVNQDQVSFHLWSVRGEPQYAHVRPMYYKGAAGVLCVFDLANRASFAHVPQWVNEVFAVTGPIPVVLFGNKAEVAAREVSREAAEALAQEGGLQYVEASAKTGDGVSDGFHLLAEWILSLTSSIRE